MAITFEGRYAECKADHNNFLPLYQSFFVSLLSA
jgi:hypothetical protein